MSGYLEMILIATLSPVFLFVALLTTAKLPLDQWYKNSAFFANTYDPIISYSSLKES